MNRIERPLNPLLWFMALLLSAVLAACGGGSGGGSSSTGGSTGSGSVAPGATALPGVAGSAGAAASNPTATSSSPASGATNVATTTTSAGASPVVSAKLLTANFSEAMLAASITAAGTFTLKNNTLAGVDVPGAVTMNAANTSATFTPAGAALNAASNYTATISTAARNAGGTAMPSPVAWSFTTGPGLVSAQAPVDLGVAGNFTILAETLISNALTAGTAITGDIGISPAAATFITGFSLTLDGTGDFSRPTPATLVTGKVFAADYVGPANTPATLLLATGASRAAYTDAHTRPQAAGPFLNPGAAGSIGGLTLEPGLYSFTGGSANVTIPTDLTLDGVGDPDAVWIFQIPGTLALANSMKINLIRNARAKNVFWKVTGAVTLQGGTSQFEGVILTASNIAMVTGAKANSRLLAQTQVALDSNTVTPPAP